MSVNAEQSARRLKSIYDHWKANPEAWGNVSSFVVANGPANKTEDEITYRKATAFQMRLFEYELPDTIMLLTPTEVHVVTTGKKIEFLKPVTEPWKTQAGITLKTHEKPKGGDGKDQILALIAAAKEAGSPLGYLAKEDVTGDLCTLLDNEMKASGIELFDCTPSLAMAMAPKDKEEVTEMKRAALLCTQALEKGILAKIEDIVDNNGKIKHSALAQQNETAALDPTKPPLEVKLKAENVSIAHPFVVQSGGNYDLKLGAQSDDERLHYDPLGVIVCRLGVKYKSYCALIGRTYLINPTAEMTAAYNALHKAHQAAIAAATDGAKLSSIYEAARTSLAESDEKLVEHLPKSIGHVTGLELREGQMVVNAKNERCVQAGTVVYIATALQNMVNESGANDKEKNYAMCIGDCVVVTKGAAEIITSKAKAVYSDISYEIKDDDEEEVKEEAAEPVRTKGASAVLNAKTRGEAGKGNEEQEAIRKQKQEELAKRKNAETLARLTEQSQRANAAASTSQASVDINAFRSAADIVPQRSREGMIVVDDARDAVLLPIYGALVPFHASTIKNALLVTGESRFSVIRISFNIPGGTLGAATWAPALANPDCTFIRELSFRSSDARHAEEVTMGIKTLVKQVKQRESERRERSQLVVQEKLKLRHNKGRILTLREVWMRPAAARTGKGRKIPGTLECHDNGFRYTNPREEHVDIIFSNIKHALVQTGGKREMITLVHFHLHNPIMVGKKKTNDVQFFTEVVEAVQNVDGARRSMLDPEELEDEQRERERRNRINKEYKNFCKNVQEQWEKEHPQLELEWDAPYGELGFQGVPYKSQSWIYPTLNCLVDLVETPFFVITLRDVEIVNLERVSFGIRNFDMAIVFKDFNREPHKVTSIDIKHLDGVKEWMTKIGIKYYESKMNLNWKPILKTILDDPEDFIANGGWDFLNLEQTDSDDEAEEESDAYEPTESEDSSDDDDDDSSLDSEGDDSDDSDGSGSEEDSEEEGKDWDELEREAMEEDEDAEESDSEERRAKKRKAGAKGAPAGKGGPPPKKGKGPPPPAAKKGKK